MKKTLIGLAVCVALTGCATQNPDGTKTTSVGQTAGLGAVLGGVVGAIAGGKTGAAIGAGVGAIAGGLVGYERRLAELETANRAKAEIVQETGFQPVVMTRPVQREGKRYAAFEAMRVEMPASKTVTDGGLQPGAARAFGKMDALARQQGTTLTISVPRSASSSVLSQIRAAAPGARIQPASGKTFVASVGGSGLQQGEVYAL